MYQPPKDRYIKAILLSAPKFAQHTIWLAMHQCYCSEPVAFESAPVESKSGELVVKHLLNGDKGHYSPLECVSFVFNLSYLPHDIMVQLSRHRHFSFSIQSFRYTDAFKDLDTDKEMCYLFDEGKASVALEKLIYVRPVGKYPKRGEAGFYDVDNRTRLDRFRTALFCVEQYQRLLEEGASPEDARNSLPAGYRQHAVVSGNLRTWMHLLDMRHKSDAQPEWLTLTNQLVDIFSLELPEVFGWYVKNRLGKGKLAP